jgi:D-cysteine desulfhydrase
MAAVSISGPASGVLHAVPRLPLALLPTPLVRASRLERRLGCPQLWVKRDDLTGFAAGGNKVRKLELLVGAALAEGCDSVVTGGGPGSNHCTTTAVAASAAGLHCVLVLYGAPPPAGRVPPPLALALDVGARVRFTGEHDRGSVDRQLAAAADDERRRGRRPYVIPRGGATTTGSLAYVAALDELAGQLREVGVVPAVLLVATGAAGTQAGLLAGTVAGGHPWRVVGASVSRPLDECAERVLALARGCTRRLGCRDPRRDEVHVVDARGPSYGAPSPAGEAVTRLAARTEGLLLDPVYTAKALAVVGDLTDLDGPVVFWHTGGLPMAIAASVDRAGRA